jgi:hypothetical protein
MVKARDNYQKQYNYTYGMSKMFFLVGINPQKTDSFVLRAIKMFSVLKTILYSLLIISM